MLLSTVGWWWPFSIYEVAECVRIAHEKALTPSNIINAFKKCGVYPFDAKVFTDRDFIPSEVTNRNDSEWTQNQQVEEAIPTCSTSGADPPQVARRKGKSIIATDSPEKQLIEEKALARENKILKNSQSTKRQNESFWGFQKLGWRTRFRLIIRRRIFYSNKCGCFSRSRREKRQQQIRKWKIWKCFFCAYFT